MRFTGETPSHIQNNESLFYGEVGIDKVGTMANVKMIMSFNTFIWACGEFPTGRYIGGGRDNAD